MPSVSAVMIAYNEAEFLRTTLPNIVQACEQVVVLDMESTDGSQDIYREFLRPIDIVADYSRRNLFEFGFSHPRNYARQFARGDFIFAIDADELVDPTDFRIAFSKASNGRVFDAERKNYEVVPDLRLEEWATIIQTATFTLERHRRLYRRDPQIRFEGLVHEELWDGPKCAFENCGQMDLTIHHLSAYREVGDSHTKGELYAHLLLKAYLHEGFRFGTNPWFFDTFVPDNLDVFIAQANNFAARFGLAGYKSDALRAVQALR